MGDFNLPNVDWDNYTAPNEPCYNLFMSFVNNNGLQQYVSEPTRFGNILDLILTFNTYLISDVSVQCPFSTSDHNMISCSINTESYCVNEEYYYYDFKEADFDRFKNFLSHINWDHELSFVFTVDDYWKIFSSVINQGIQMFVPLRNVKSNITKNRKTYPRRLRLMLNHKAVPWKKWHNTKDLADKQAYKDYALKCRRELHTFQCSRELQLIENGSTSKFYRFVNRTLGSLRSSQPIFDSHSNTLVEDPYKQANIFNNYFGSCFYC